MRLIKHTILIIYFLSIGHVWAQSTPFTLRSSIGLATYYGDLTEKAKLFKQSSPSFSIGLNYDITEQIIGKFEFSLMKLKADDRLNTRTDLLNRNLNFTTTLWDIQIGAEYEFLNMVSEEYLISPYLGLGLGILHFNPWTYDRIGEKRYLREFATEGQGLPSYPERKVYSKISMFVPINFGVKYVLNENVKLFFDVNFRRTFTDHLDDVGANYPDRNIILNESKDPLTTIGLTYRGDEVSSNPYPSTSLVRGGYSKDFYYTISIGAIIRLENITIGGGGGAGGLFKRIGRVGSRSSRLKNPGRVF